MQMVWLEVAALVLAVALALLHGVVAGPYVPASLPSWQLGA